MLRTAFFALAVFSTSFALAADRDGGPLFLVKAAATTRAQRNALVNEGLAIDAVHSDGVYLVATADEVARARRTGIALEVNRLPDRFRDFPSGDKAFHDFARTVQELDRIAAAHPAIATRFSLGKSGEERDLAGIRLSGKKEADSLPTAIFLGCHHAREHLSVEVPLLLAGWLADNYATNERVKQLLDTREVWIVPMVNPDGAEYDIATGKYRWWRKNRRDNGKGSFGVDLNRNYGGPNFGGGGSSGSPSSDIYHGPSGFSEPETAAVRDFVRARKKTTVLLTFHTYSELILWPWGWTDDVLPNDKDRQVFETAGKKMAEWNHYTPEKSSQLYITSGDTTDWAYDELKIFAFTFELSPSSLSGAGFYPGAKAIQPTFQANLEPALYLIEMAENPFRVLDN